MDANHRGHCNWFRSRRLDPGLTIRCPGRSRAELACTSLTWPPTHIGSDDVGHSSPRPCLFWTPTACRTDSVARRCLSVAARVQSSTTSRAERPPTARSHARKPPSGHGDRLRLYQFSRPRRRGALRGPRARPDRASLQSSAPAATSPCDLAARRPPRRTAGQRSGVRAKSPCVSNWPPAIMATPPESTRGSTALRIR